MKPEILKHLPVWLLLVLAGAGTMVVGASTTLEIGKLSLHLAFPNGIVVMATGAILMSMAFADFLRSRKHGEDGFAVERVEVRSIKVEQVSGSPPRALVSGRIEPPTPGVHVWLAREHQAQTPGRFHPSPKPALTDKNGEWQQFTYLWPEGVFRIHAVVGGRTAEALFRFYRQAYEHSRSVYQQRVDGAAIDFPGWPRLEELPPGCVSDFDVVTV